jgi:hypothetical protein
MHLEVFFRFFGKKFIFNSNLNFEFGPIANRSEPERSGPDRLW